MQKQGPKSKPGINEQAKRYAIELTKEGEGLCLKVYNDTLGNPTIGYGHLLEKHEIGKLIQITKEEAQQILLKDLQKAINAVLSKWGETYLQKLNDERTAVIIDMTFNMGPVKFNPKQWPKFSTEVRNQDWDKAGLAILKSKYAQHTKKRAHRNAAIMVDGKMHKKK